MTITAALPVLLGLWFLIWGLNQFFGGPQPFMQRFLAVLAIVIGIIYLLGRFAFSAG
jgi:hypothetical protein